MWEVRELMSTLAGRCGIFFIGCAFRVGGARADVNLFLIAGVICCLLCAHFVWEVCELISTLAGRRGFVVIGCAFRVGGARVDVNF
jgi:hypothetical protein